MRLASVERKIFLVVVFVELVFSLLMIAWRGTVFYCGDATYHEYIPLLMLENKDLRVLGVVWLPLLHLLVAPFLLVNWFYKTGFAGSIVNSLATGVTAVFFYKLIGRGKTALIAVLLLLTNLFTLVYGSTPMMEQLAVMFIVMAAYYLKQYLSYWRLKDFFKLSIALSLGCLSRYEVWVVTGVAIAYVFLTSLKFKKYSRALITPLLGLGILAWMAWNYYLTRDFLGFLHASMGAGFYASVYLKNTSLAYRLRVILTAIIIVSGFYLFWTVKHVLFCVKKRRVVEVLIISLLLTPLIFHTLLVIVKFSFGWLRYFYLAVPGMIYSSYNYHLERKNKKRRVEKVVKTLTPFIIVTLAIQVLVMVQGNVYGFMPRVMWQHRGELSIIKQAIKNETVLIGTDAAGWFSAMTGTKPSQIIDGFDYEFERAMLEPWKHVKFVVIKKMKQDPMLEGLNKLYNGNFYIYNYYYNNTWRSEFLTHYKPVVKTQHYELYKKV